jgi:hypothetical protein
MRVTYKRRLRKRKPRRRKTLRGGSKNITFYNSFHYGDNILNLKFFYNISAKLKEKGITITYMYDPGYIKNVKELERYVDSKVVTLKPIPSGGPGDAISLWMGDPINEVTPMNTSMEVYYDLFYKKILGHLGLDPSNIDTSLYQDEPYLEDIYRKLDSKFKDIDILIINAEPQSKQFVYDKKKMDQMCKRLSKTHNIVTTTPVDDSIKCTMRDGLALQDIGAISTRAKYIIAIYSGPITPCYNLLAKNNVKRWIILVNQDYTMKEVDTVIIKSPDELANIEQYLT